MKTKYTFDLVSKIDTELQEKFKDYKVYNNYHDKICKEISEIVHKHKEALLLTWYSAYGFEPNKAVFVEDRSDPIKIKFYIEERK